MTADEHTAFPVADSAQPTQDAPVGHRGELKGAQGNAACHGVACKASTAAGEGRSGSLRRRCLDSVVAPYRRVLGLERRVGMSVECSREKTLSEPTKG